MADRAFRLSPYKIETFHLCPRRYRFQYVDDLRAVYRKPWPHLTLGNNVHQALKDFFSRGNRDRSFAGLEKLLRRRWAESREGFADLDEERGYWHRALGMARWYCDTQDTAAQPHMLEAVHSVRLDPDLALLGRVDRVDLCPDGSFHIIDYKTGRRHEPVNRFPLLAYALLLSRRCGVIVSQVSYLFLQGDGWWSVQPSPEDLARAESHLLAARDEILAEERFLPRPNRLCGWCDFLEICDVGRERVAPGEPAGEPEEPDL